MSDTPGPWIAYSLDNGTFGIGQLDLILPPVAWAIHERDARLIAAAPDLLAALREIEREVADEKPDGTLLGYLAHDAEEMADIARAAIAKATGNSESAPTSRT